MAALGQSRQVLEILSKTLGFIPVVGENLKSAAELASKICEEIEVREELVIIRDPLIRLCRPSKRIVKATSASALKSGSSSSPSRASSTRRSITRESSRQESRMSRI
jgi:hypothetical protein